MFCKKLIIRWCSPARTITWLQSAPVNLLLSPYWWRPYNISLSFPYPPQAAKDITKHFLSIYEIGEAGIIGHLKLGLCNSTALFQIWSEPSWIQKGLEKVKTKVLVSGFGHISIWHFCQDIIFLLRHTNHCGSSMLPSLQADSRWISASCTWLLTTSRQSFQVPMYKWFHLFTSAQTVLHLGLPEESVHPLLLCLITDSV